MNSPCLKCYRVEDPAACEDKNCRVWRKWFVEKWDGMRVAPRLEVERRPREAEGIVIGGVRYAMPHRVRDYLEKDPCQGCLCPRDLCVIPCRVKRDWQSVRENVLM